MPRRKREHFFCLRTYENLPTDLILELHRGKNSVAREMFKNHFLSQNQIAWLKTVKHWYLHLEYDPDSRDHVLHLKILKSELNYSQANVVLGALLFG